MPKKQPQPKEKPEPVLPQPVSPERAHDAQDESSVQGSSGDSEPLIDLPHIREIAIGMGNAWQGAYLLTLMQRGSHADACRIARVDPAFVAMEKERSKEFGRALAAIEDVRPMLAEASLLQLAVQGKRVEYYDKDGKIRRVEFQKDIRAIQLFLEAHHPNYQDAGPGGGTPREQLDAVGRSLKGGQLEKWMRKKIAEEAK